MQKQLLCDKLILTIIPGAVSPSAYLAVLGLELLLGPRPLSSVCLPCNDSGQGLGSLECQYQGEREADISVYIQFDLDKMTRCNIL